LRNILFYCQVFIALIGLLINLKILRYLRIDLSTTLPQI
jgi:hypothetical protein